MRAAEDSAQATVEMAVVAPVMIVLALIVYNIMVFAGAVARFDRVAPDIVLAHAIAPEGEGDAPVDASPRVSAALESAMQGYDLEIEVTSEAGTPGGQDAILSLEESFRTYTCAMRFKPWPQGFAIAGVSLGAPAVLSHERAVTIDPWRPGVVA